MKRADGTARVDTDLVRQSFWIRRDAHGGLVKTGAGQGDRDRKVDTVWQLAAGFAHAPRQGLTRSRRGDGDLHRRPGM